MKVQDPVDRALFFSSTYIQVGNGKNTSFWETRWLNGAAPKEIVPDLYSLTRFKFWNVHSKLQDHRWIKSLGEINLARLLEEYVILYLAISTVTLNDHNDAICWKWTSNGKYSVSSAYNYQFKGDFTYFLATSIWKASAEPKCKFFGWLLMHNKAPTVDNLAKKN
jgi:hypothetical protein